MKTQTYPLSLGDTIPLDQAIGDGGTVVFHSNAIDLYPDGGAQIDNTSVNVLSAEGDNLLHVSFRRVENAIVFNSYEKGGNWGKEERIKLFGLFQRTDATITIRVHKECYVVLIDGQPIKTYTQRIKKDIKAASYSTNSRSVLSDTISVTIATADDEAPPSQHASSHCYQDAYFPLKASELAEESEKEPFDYIIIGSGIGGGVLAADLLEKNKRLTSSKSDFTSRSTPAAPGNYSGWNRSAVEANAQDDRSKRILVIERGGLLFNTHSLNMPRPTSRGTYGQMNDLFYNHFKEQWDMDEDTAKIWKGGPVYCLGGRSTVWGLFSPRISNDTFRSHFPVQIYDDLNKKYLRKAEEVMNVTYPQTLPLHRALIDGLNIRERDSRLPTTQWEWGRVASEFKNEKNFDFAEGAFSTVDKLVEAGMDDPQGRGRFKTLLESRVDRLEPKPEAGKQQPVTHVVVKDEAGEYKIKCNNAVIAAGAVDSPAILLRSAAGTDIKTAYGKNFARDFGHVTDHYIFYVTLPFFYKNMANKDLLGGMKLQTDITFTTVDNTTALANVSLDASGFLPRRNVPDSDLPQFIIAYILPSELAKDNKVELNDKKEPRIECGYADDANIEDKKEVLRDFAVDVMNKIAANLDVQFVKHPFPDADYIPLTKVTKADITLGELGPGGVAHEMGSIPMPNKAGQRGILDQDLKMQYGWENVYVCDLSVFPYSPAANPTLSLAALSLRLSDHLVPTEKTLYQPIVVYNLLQQSVFVEMTLSNSDKDSFGPTARTEIKSGSSVTWKRETNETIYVRGCACSTSFNVQMVYPGINALITNEAPKNANCTCA